MKPSPGRFHLAPVATRRAFFAANGTPLTIREAQGSKRGEKFEQRPLGRASLPSGVDLDIALPAPTDPIYCSRPRCVPSDPRRIRTPGSGTQPHKGRRFESTAAHHAFRNANRRRRKAEGRDDAVAAVNRHRDDQLLKQCLSLTGVPLSIASRTASSVSRMTSLLGTSNVRAESRSSSSLLRNSVSRVSSASTRVTKRVSGADLSRRRCSSAAQLTQRSRSQPLHAGFPTRCGILVGPRATAIARWPRRRALCRRMWPAGTPRPPRRVHPP